MFKPIVIPSPNIKYNAILTYTGEIQTNQPGYSLSIDGLSYAFTDRVFGKVCLWSPRSRFLAVQEWKEGDEADDPGYCLLSIIDVIARRECIIANVEGTKGIVLPERFIGESLLYTVTYYGRFGLTKSFESKFRYLDGWQTLK